MLRNDSNISLAMAVWLATDFYDHSDDPNEISATALLKPVREVVLSRRATEEGDYDILNSLSSSMGTAIHMNIEQAWLNPALKKVLDRLGLPPAIQKKLVLNPKELKAGDIPVYMEIRSKKKMGQFTVSGKFDFALQGELTDFKSTKVYGWINDTNSQKYILQGSIYRWLNPEIITKDTMNIDYVFTDWSKLGQMQNKRYPPAAVMTEKYNLLSLAETEHFIRTKLNQIAQFEEAPQEQLPRCNDDELWRSDPVFKYYKNPNNKKRSTKNFPTMAEAMVRLHADGAVGEVVEVKSKVVACKFCSALGSCTQAEGYLLTKELEL